MIFTKRFSLIFIFICLSVFSFSENSGNLNPEKIETLMRYMSVSYPLKKIKITSPYGYRYVSSKKKTFHYGLDLQARYETVYSMFDGVVDTIGSNSRAGNYVTVRYGKYTVSYCHLSKRYVSIGDSLFAGDPVAVSGNTGNSTGPHLHLTCKRSGKYVNPNILIAYIRHIRTKCVLALGGSIREALPCREFFSVYAPLAIEQQRKYGIPASVTLSQMALESGWGMSDIAQECNNYFGMKASSRWLKEGKPFSSRYSDSPTDKFCVYSSVKESIEHHSDLLTSKRYKKYCNFPPKDYRNWLKGLSKAGYSTNKNYTKLCLTLINKYKLYVYDYQA